MDLNLPKIINDYIKASNAHDVEAILACFSEEATVRDENETLHGKSAIKDWVVKTIEKYSFQFAPLRMRQDENEATVSVNVSSTFPGSPITLDYNFTIGEGRISSLSIAWRYLLNLPLPPQWRPDASLPTVTDQGRVVLLLPADGD